MPIKPPSSPLYYPSLTKISTIASDTEANLRDPTTPIFDPVDSLWHFWATRIPVQNGTAGYSGRIYHYFSPTLNSIFQTSGLAVDVAAEPGKFDSYGTFTPSAFRDSSDGRWVIFYGGVENGSISHTESIGMAVSTEGAFGPFVKSTLNPILTWNGFNWCDETDNKINSNRLMTASTPARVDECEPYIINQQRILLVKTVCSNFTALPMIFASSSNSRFIPPFKAISSHPIINAKDTVNQRGFEQARIYPGPDGYLHLTGNNHGDGRQPHYVNFNNISTLTSPWMFVNYLHHFGDPPHEPTIVVPNHSVPGDDYTHGVPSYFIQFTGEPLHIDLMKNTWMEYHIEH